MPAVHIKIAHSLNTDSMIKALRRFTSVHGYPKEIRSDCGTNFTKADKELKASIKEWNHQKIENFCVQKGIEWNFNPPGASHMGGAWERMISSVRQILRAFVKEQIVCDELLSTVIAEATNILNSRSLTRNSDDPKDDPNHLLQLRPCSSLAPGLFDKDDQSSQHQWRQAQYLPNLFWRRWTREDLPNLQEGQKWKGLKDNLKINDILLLMDENFPRGQWPLTRVVEVVPSKDGLMRSAKVKTSSTVVTRANGEIKTNTTILTRPLTKLCRLEIDEGCEQTC